MLLTSKDDCLRLLEAVVNSGQHGEDEGSSFSSTGLRLTDHVLGAVIAC